MTEFRNVVKTTEIPEGRVKRVDLDDQDLEILIAHVGDSYLAFDNVCQCIAHFAGHTDAVGENKDHHTHGGHLRRLERGHVEGDTIACPEHTTVYSMRTGRPQSGPGEISLGTYEIRVENGELRVALMSDAMRHFWNDAGHKHRP